MFKLFQKSLISVDDSSKPLLKMAGSTTYARWRLWADFTDELTDIKARHFRNGKIHKDSYYVYATITNMEQNMVEAGKQGALTILYFELLEHPVSSHESSVPYCSCLNHAQNPVIYLALQIYHAFDPPLTSGKEKKNTDVLTDFA